MYSQHHKNTIIKDHEKQKIENDPDNTEVLPNKSLKMVKESITRMKGHQESRS